MLNKPFSESCIQNQDVILDVLKQHFKNAGNVLEVGSGTGQHAVHFASNLPHLNWIPSDVEAHLAGMKMWFDEANLSNIKPAVAFDVTKPEQHPNQYFDFMFTANTLHIMSWHEVEQLFTFVGKQLNTGGCFIVYGPFNYKGQYTSESNKRFDGWLKQLAGDSSIKHFEAIEKLANQHDMQLLKDITMPANNRILVWQKKA